jgi:hypothetical protein
MTDITERLRSIYVSEGANYVTEAADTIERLRAESDRAKQYHADELVDVIAERNMWKELLTQRDRQIKGLVNDVHSCHAGCTLAGCVTQRLQARVAHLEQLVTDAVYTLSKARIWGGMDWHYNPLHPIHYKPMRDRLAVEGDAIYAARGEPK